MGRWLSFVTLLACVAASMRVWAQDLSVEAIPNGRVLQYDGRPLMELDSPGVLAGASERIYRFPGAVPATGSASQKADTDGHGQWKEAIASEAGKLTIRYEFDDLPASSASTRVEWTWRLDPAAWRDTMAVGVEASPGQPERPFGLRPIDGLRLNNLKQLTLARPDADITIAFRASDGALGSPRCADAGSGPRLSSGVHPSSDGRWTDCRMV